MLLIGRPQRDNLFDVQRKNYQRSCWSLKKNSLHSVTVGEDWCLGGSGIIFLSHTCTYTHSHTQPNNSKYHLKMSTKSDTCMENTLFCNSPLEQKKLRRNTR